MSSLTAKLLALALLASTAGCASSNPSKAARSLYEAGRPAEAKPYAEIALARAQRGLASDHPAVGRRVYELAQIEDALGNYAEAQQLYGRVLAIQTKSLGPESPKVGKILHLLAGTYAAQGQNTQAQNLYRRALAIREKAVGPDHPQVAQTLLALGRLHLDLGGYSKAEPYLRRALAIQLRPPSRTGARLRGPRTPWARPKLACADMRKPTACCAKRLRSGRRPWDPTTARSPRASIIWAASMPSGSSTRRPGPC